ncbi:MAG: ferredoxin family protein [Acidobacteriota bacterium]
MSVVRGFVAERAQSLDGERRLSVVRTLLEKGIAVSCRRDEPPVPSDGMLLVGRFGQEPPAATTGSRVLDLDQADPGALDALADELQESPPAVRPGAWKPWFPVIDYDRCTNCMQCLSFCLFDVYGVTADGRIQVQKQSNCKTECPACSRVCPEVAIMFPKYRHGPINGEQVNTDDVRREAMKVDISTLLGGDIYQALRDRSAKAKSRFSKERDDDRALRERQNCLVKLQQALDIPAEVMASLPSLDEIQAKAEAARRRAVPVSGAGRQET